MGYTAQGKTDTAEKHASREVETVKHASFFRENYPLGLLSLLRDFACQEFRPSTPPAECGAHWQAQCRHQWCVGSCHVSSWHLALARKIHPVCHISLKLRNRSTVMRGNYTAKDSTRGTNWQTAATKGNRGFLLSLSVCPPSSPTTYHVL